ncbi:MAG: preprotein translocase subunit SecE [Patescibacteria group bacterium]
MFGKIITFFKEVQVEIKKINWPTRQDIIRYTLIVIASSVIIAFFLGGVDLIIQKLLEIFILK